MPPNNFFVFTLLGSYDAYVLGAFLVMFALMALEPFLLARRRKQLVSAFRKRMQNADSSGQPKLPNPPEKPPE